MSKQCVEERKDTLQRDEEKYKKYGRILLFNIVIIFLYCLRYYGYIIPDLFVLFLCFIFAICISQDADKIFFEKEVQIKKQAEKDQEKKRGVKYSEVYKNITFLIIFKKVIISTLTILIPAIISGIILQSAFNKTIIFEQKIRVMCIFALVSSFRYIRNKMAFLNYLELTFHVMVINKMIENSGNWHILLFCLFLLILILIFSCLKFALNFMMLKLKDEMYTLTDIKNQFKINLDEIFGENSCFSLYLEYKFKQIFSTFMYMIGLKTNIKNESNDEKTSMIIFTDYEVLFADEKEKLKKHLFRINKSRYVLQIEKIQNQFKVMEYKEEANYIINRIFRAPISIIMSIISFLGLNVLMNFFSRGEFTSPLSADLFFNSVLDFCLAILLLLILPAFLSYQLYIGIGDFKRVLKMIDIALKNILIDLKSEQEEVKYKKIVRDFKN